MDKLGSDFFFSPFVTFLDFFCPKTQKKRNEKTYFIFIVITIKFEFFSFLVLMKNASKNV